MSGPLPELLEAYGTRDYYLRKQAGIIGDLSNMWANRIMYGKAGTPMLSAATQLAGELAPPVAFLGMMRRSNRQDAELMAEAQMMNQQFRDEEHARMAGTISAFGGGSGGYPGMAWEGEQKLSGVLKPEVEKVAVSLGRAMAHELVKSAGMGAPVASFGSKVLGGIKNFFQAGANRMASSQPTKILTPMRKLKILGLGAGVAAGAGLYSAGKSAKQYMMIPTAQEHQGGHAPAPRANITPYGY